MTDSPRVAGRPVCLMFVLSCTSSGGNLARNAQDATPAEVKLDLFDLPPQAGETSHPNPEVVGVNSIERVVTLNRVITVVATGIDPDGVRAISIHWQSAPECRRSDGTIVARGKFGTTVSNAEASGSDSVVSRRTVSTTLRLADSDSECESGETLVRRCIIARAEASNYGVSNDSRAQASLIYPSRIP